MIDFADFPTIRTLGDVLRALSSADPDTPATLWVTKCDINMGNGGFRITDERLTIRVTVEGDGGAAFGALRDKYEDGEYE